MERKFTRLHLRVAFLSSRIRRRSAHRRLILECEGVRRSLMYFQMNHGGDFTLQEIKLFLSAILDSAGFFSSKLAACFNAAAALCAHYAGRLGRTQL